MIKKQLLFFLIRWAGSSLGMWICLTLFGQINNDYNGWIYVVAGLAFSLVNAIVKPLARMIAAPLLALTMGIFTIVLNIALVALTIAILPDVEMDFWGLAASALILSVINYLINLIVPVLKIGKK